MQAHWLVLWMGALVMSGSLVYHKTAPRGLSGADLGHVRIHGSMLGRGDFAGANFFRAGLSHTCLEASSLEGANLARSDLDRASLGEARLTGANLFQAR